MEGAKERAARGVVAAFLILFPYNIIARWDPLERC